MKPKNNSMSIFRIIWIILLICIALLIVYLYRLQTEGQFMKLLLKTTGSVINFLEKNPQVFYVLLSYIPIFYGGYMLGKKRRSKRKR